MFTPRVSLSFLAPAKRVFLQARKNLFLQVRFQNVLLRRRRLRLRVALGFAPYLAEFSDDIKMEKMAISRKPFGRSKRRTHFANRATSTLPRRRGGKSQKRPKLETTQREAT